MELWSGWLLGGGVAVTVAATLLALGERLRTVFRLPGPPSLRPALSWALGSWAVAAAVMGLGVCGVLRPSALLLLLGLAAAAGRWSRVPALARCLMWALLAALPLLPIALAPPFFYDAWVYHLGLPWQALLDGRLTALPGHTFSAFPPLAQLLYTLPLSFGALRAPGLLHLLASCVAAAATAALARRLGASGAWAGLAGVCVLYSPVAPVMAAFPASEAWAVSGIVAALALLSGAGRGCAIGRASGAGGLFGSAMACRLQGLPWAVIGLALLIFESRRRLRSLMVFLGALLVGSMPWWLKNALLLADPLAPLGWRHEGIETLWRDASSNVHLAAGVMDLSARVGGALQSHAGLLAPLLVLGLARVLLGRDRAALLVVGAATGGALAWALTGALDRFLVATLALLLAVAVSGRGWLGRGVAALAVALVLGPGLLRTASLYGHLGGVAVAGRAAEVYASLVVSNPREGFEACNALPAEARVLLVGEPRGFLFPRRFETGSQHDRPLLAALLERNAEPGGVVSELRARGFTHLLVHVTEMQRLAPKYPARPWKDAAGRDRFVELTRYLEPPILVKDGIVVYEMPRE